ncbi:MAG TPA: PTS sugar transporter subunit IIA [Gemmatimonadales bacterium]|nr:PTS sugar transporter subunit IIA [Gemmatimonadales bacterium]
MPNQPGRVSDLLTPERVVLPLEARDKPGAIAELSRALVATCGGDYDDVLRAVMERERSLSTGVGGGVAIPHGRAATVPGLCLVSGVSAEPVPYEALDGQPVRLFFLVVGPETAAGEHVKLLARIAHLIRHDALRERLTLCHTPEEFHRTLQAAEAA